VAASLARIWENVLDWEHLPWLHRDTFAAIRPLVTSREGWCAAVDLQGGSEPLVIEVVLERAAMRYHTRTLEGPGAGTDIVTVLTPADAGRTRVDVAFHLPEVDPAAVAALGAFYRTVYAKLWDEDEAMMIRRQAVLDGAPAPACREVVVGDLRRRFVPVCPHLGGPLEDAPVTDGCVTCPWHGYRFDLRTGRSADGRGLTLRMA